MGYPKNEAKAKGGFSNDIRLEPAFERIRDAEQILSEWMPITTVAANVMLEAAIDILQVHKRDPEHSLGKGPAMEILKNVATALAYRDIPIREKDAA
jgi:hypothetical protein